MPQGKRHPAKAETACAEETRRVEPELSSRPLLGIKGRQGEADGADCSLQVCGSATSRLIDMDACMFRPVCSGGAGPSAVRSAEAGNSVWVCTCCEGMGELCA